MMRLGFHYHVPAMLRDSGIFMPGVQGRFLDSLAEHCEAVVCFLHSPRQDELEWMDYRVYSPNVSLVNIGLHTSVMHRTLKSRLFTSHLRNYASDLDVLLLRGPSPLLPSMAASSTVPTTLLLVGDYVRGVNDLPQPRWRKEAIRLWSHWNKWMQQRIAYNSLIFVNSHVLYDQLKDEVPNLIETRTTTLKKEDFYIREDTCQSKPIRLLYVGRMDRTKGLLQMVEAVAQLVERGEDVILDLVGWLVHNDPVLENLESLARMKHIQERIRYLGVKPLGPELYKCYKKADIFVISSFFEGFPRVIWEAFSQSTPVIASKVGSIPFFLRHEQDALLASPNNPEELAFLLNRVINEPELRRRLIRNGRQLAQQNTLDFRAKEMMNCIKDWLRDRATIHAN